MQSKIFTFQQEWRNEPVGWIRDLLVSGKIWVNDPVWVIDMEGEGRRWQIGGVEPTLGNQEYEFEELGAIWEVLEGLEKQAQLL